MTAFRIGVIGVGRMGRCHLRALASSETVRVVAVADPSPAARAAVSAEGVAVYATVDELLDAGGIDGVLITAPTGQHLPLVRLVAACELPILCEKPCGLSAAEARQAARFATDAGVRLQVAYWRRFVADLQRLQQAIAEGRFGEIYSIACWQWDERPPASGFRATSGGIFVDMGVHEFDQMRWLTGQEIVALDAVTSTVADDTILPPDADSAHVLCRLSGGSAGIVSLGRRFQPGDAAWVQVFGTREAEECRFLWPGDGEDVFMEALRCQAECFAAGGGAGATSDDAIAALEAAERAGGVAFNRN